MKYTIFQLNLHDNELIKFAYKDWNSIKNDFDFDNYTKTYEGEIEEIESEIVPGPGVIDYLEEIFEICNIKHPKDYKGHSLSVSDIVLINDSYYYCDSMNWEDITAKVSFHLEMKLWKIRENDEFGALLKAIRNLTNDYFVPEADENGIISNPISNFIAEYSLDGNRKTTYFKLNNLLESWDIIGNDEGVDNLMNELKNLI